MFVSYVYVHVLLHTISINAKKRALEIATGHKVS